MEFPKRALAVSCLSGSSTRGLFLVLDSIATTVVVKFSWLANFNLFNVGSSVMVMGDFPVGKCQVVWQKDATSEAERQAILRELRQMAVELQEAIDFTIKLSNKKIKRSQILA